MTIFLNRKGLESPLVEMPRSFGVVVSVPTHCVGMRQPPKEIGYLILVLRFDNKMPMIGHRESPNKRCFDSRQVDEKRYRGLKRVPRAIAWWRKN